MFSFLFRYIPLKRKAVSTKICKNLPSVKSEIRQLLKDAPSLITCTTDGWTSAALDSYIVITAHFLNADWQMQGLIIGFEEMAIQHTGENLCEKFVEVVKDFRIENKIGSIVSDNANNAMLGITLAAAELSTGDHTVQAHRCMAHIINLIVKAGLQTLSQPLETLKAIVKKLRKSNNALTALEGFCAGNSEKFKMPQKPTPTRWNSTYTMIESMAGMKKSLQNVKASGHLEEGLSSENWGKLTLLLKVLHPFLSATELLSGSSYCTLSLGAEVADNLCKHLSEHAKSCEQIGIKDMIAKLGEYRSDIYQQSQLPAFLDPRLRHTADDAVIPKVKGMLRVLAPATVEKPKKGPELPRPS